MSTSPLTPVEEHARIHAHLMTFGFLVCLPLGVLVARYFRTFTNKWWYGHSLLQFLVSGPIIIAGWVFGHQTTTTLESGHYDDPHKKIGLALLILYIAQLVIGLTIHYFKTPRLFNGHRPPQNYFHALFGLAIIALASYQVHYGMFTEWALALGNSHPVHPGCKHFWLGTTVAFFGLYFIGMVFLPRQYKQESASRGRMLRDDDNGSGSALKA